MKRPIPLVLTLLILSLPIAAQAACDRYPNSEFGLSLPHTITVPASLPVGSLITRQAFNGSAPGFNLHCPSRTQRLITGRFTDSAWVPGQGVTAYHTNVPGIGIRVLVRNHSGLIYPHQLHTSAPFGLYPWEKAFSNTSAEALFFKTGPVTSDTLPSGRLVEDLWDGGKGHFRLVLNAPVRFVEPAATCDLAAGDVNRTITLDPVQVSAFNSEPFAGAHTFELSANCNDAANVTFRFTGAPSSENNLLFANTGTAGGVALWLYSRINGTNRTIPANGSDNERTLVVTGNRAVLPLGAAYHKSGTVGQGTLISTATVNITYN
ncbi:type 1 fimbrial protein [Pseudomonas carnis]|uniref:fimbrial protein n=1 Tax=Pseudomonas carnis TaxID=2487355 RepID=UPI0018D9A814|nr:fimbrial protein [Pseudomonas carnis]MBH3367430.1 type 1 fimbrial protein [Pseudomonas carnis]